MRNFFLFIQRYSHFFLFILLESISFYAIYQFHVYHHAVIINSANNFNGGILKQRNNIVRYFSLADENLRLQNENKELRCQVLESYYIDKKDTIRNTDSSFKQKFTYIPGTVIQSTTDLTNNYITIDKGRLHGVNKNMGVIGPDGLVGTIVTVSDNFSLAMTILNSKFVATPKLPGNTSIGKLVWPGTSPYYANIDGINKFNTIKKGDLVKTSFTKLYPENVMIGKIVDIKSSPNSAFYKVKIKLSTDFTKLKSVYIINNLQINEIQKLEEQLNSGN